MVKCECGLSYVQGLPVDEDEHRKIHEHFEHGVPLHKGIETLPRIPLRDCELIVIDSEVPFYIRKRFYELLAAAYREMPCYPIGYDGTVDESQQTLFVLAKADRAVGFALFSLDSGCWRLRWVNEEKVEIIQESPDMDSRWKLGRIWLAKRFRRRGLGRELLLKATELIPVNLEEICIELPPTPDGKRFIRRVFPDMWYGRGDRDAFEGLLESF